MTKLDVDVNVPTFPVKNIEDYDGSNTAKRAFLVKNRHRIVNWRAEWRKSIDMSAAVRITHEGRKVGGGRRSIRFRRINREIVIAEQVISMVDFLFYKHSANSSKKYFLEGATKLYLYKTNLVIQR